jgi:hypothetical protein
VAASAVRPLVDHRYLGRLWWLPASGTGNGLGDRAWAPIAVVRADIVAPLLAAFRAADVPAYAAAAHPPPIGRSNPFGPSGHSRRHPARPVSQVWVGTSGYGRAEDVLRTALPGLLRSDA